MRTGSSETRPATRPRHPRFEIAPAAEEVDQPAASAARAMALTVRRRARAMGRPPASRAGRRRSRSRGNGRRASLALGARQQRHFAGFRGAGTPEVLADALVAECQQFIGRRRSPPSRARRPTARAAHRAPPRRPDEFPLPCLILPEVPRRFHARPLCRVKPRVSRGDIIPPIDAPIERGSRSPARRHMNPQKSAGPNLPSPCTSQNPQTPPAS